MNILNFASVAEAVAHYNKLGYKTVDIHEHSRYMHKVDDDKDVIVIWHKGFLDVIAGPIVEINMAQMKARYLPGT